MKRKTGFIEESTGSKGLYMDEDVKSKGSVKIPDRSAGLGVKILSVVLALSLLVTMVAVSNNNYRDIFLSLFSDDAPQVVAPVDNESSEAPFVIPSDVVKLEINTGTQDFSTGDADTPLTDVNFEHDSAYLDAGDSTRLKYTKAPLEADISDLTWVSSDSSVLAVSNLGTVTGVSQGEAVVSLYSLKYNVRASCTIYVQEEEKTDEGQTVIPADREEETGFFTPPDEDEEGEITNTISHISSLNASMPVSQISSQISSQVSSFAPSVTVSQIQSAVSSQISSEVSSSSSTVTSLAPVSSMTSSESSPNNTEGIANKYIKVKQNDGTYVAVTVLDYLMYNTAVEMDSRYSDEAIKAQIATIYTYYIIYNMSKGASYATMEGSRTFKFNSDGTVDFSKAKYHWPESNGSFDRLKNLCLEVIGQAVLYNGKGACTTFSHMNRGASQASSPYWGSEKIPYLTIVDSKWDREVSSCKSTRSIDRDTVYDKLSELFGEENLTAEPEYWFYEIARDVPDEGYVDYVTIGSKTVSGYKVRSKFSFKSNCFFAEYDKESETFTFTVYGNGHGIGLSQEGAEGMANDGYTWKQILKHYYPGTEIAYKEPTFYEI